MIVAIDGPAGAGKSSVARQLADRLGFQFLDTGAMYRAIVCEGLHHAIDFRDDTALVDLTKHIQIDFRDDQVFVHNRNVTLAIRTVKVSSLVHFPADNARVREILVELQRQFAATRDTVTEGRDQGTVAFPDAECKVFLTATPEERARRRWNELIGRGESLTFDDVLKMQTLRDERDASREVGRLERAHDAVEIFTDQLTTDAVVEKLEAIVRQRLQARTHIRPTLSGSV